MMRLILSICVVVIVASCSSQSTREGDDLFNSGQYEEAIEAYSEYLKTRPKDIKTLYNRGRAYEELGQLENAKDDFIRVLDIDQDNLNANLSMGKYWYLKKNYRQAILFFDKVLIVDSGSSNAYLLRGRSYHQLGTFKKAIEDYNQAINTDSKNAEAFFV